MEILKLVITVLFVIAALAIIVVVLLQEGKSAGLGSLSGTTSNNDSYWEKNKKNSLEGKFERWTKITAGMFVVFALVLMLLNSSGKTKVEVTPSVDTGTTATESKVEVQPEGEQATDENAGQTTDEAATTNEGTAATEGEQTQQNATNAE